MYEALDHPDITSVLFHPRPEMHSLPMGEKVTDHLITVDPDVQVGARFHMGSTQGANLLFFHGNGEIVSDYDELGPLYNRMDINLLAADYRGYGRSGGQPSASAMMSDSHLVLKYAHDWLRENQYTGPLIVMGRSLGSASALELAVGHQKVITGLIIESGFAYTGPLLKLLGVDTADYDYQEDAGFNNLTKIGRCHMPTLVIHAEYDHIIPFSDGRALFKASPAEDKRLLKIDGANHNDILLRGLNAYMQSVGDLVSGIRPMET